MKNNKQLIEGSRAIALTIAAIKPAVVSAYPITPQTHIVEDLAKFKAEGSESYEYVRAESEFAAASIVLGASATGARTYSATSSQGLLLMAEVIYNISGMRLPVVMTVANRAVSAPINIWCFSKDTEVLMADLNYKPINQIKIGEKVLGKNKKGQLVYSTVTKLFSRQTNDLVTLKTEEVKITCTPEHKFYCRSGHNHWMEAKNLKGKNLHYFGYPRKINNNFKHGWLSGVADGDGCFYIQNNSHSFRLKCKDKEMAETFAKWSNELGYPVRKPRYMEKFGYFLAIMTLTKETKNFKKFLARKKNKDFARGYLAGIYDAEGSGPHKIKQAVIYNNDKSIVKAVTDYLKILNIKFKVYVGTRRGEHYKNDNYHIKINNVPEFFIQCPSRITRKRDNLLKMSLKSVKSRLKILDVVPIHKKTTVYNIETESNNYIANGFLVHNCDHSDIMGMRDAGAILLFAENHQEAIDQHVLAYKIAEKLSLPVFVNVDGFIATHSYESCEIPSAKLIAKFLPVYKPKSGEFLDPKNPITMGVFAGPKYYFDFRKDLQNDLLASAKLIDKEYISWKKIFPTDKKEAAVKIDNGLIEYYGPKNPKTVLVTLGSVAGTIKQVIDDAGPENSTGLLKIRCYRPFPAEVVKKVLKGAKCVISIEKSYGLGYVPPLYSDLAAALYGEKIKLESRVVGLGGQDVTEDDISKIIKTYEKI